MRRRGRADAAVALILILYSVFMHLSGAAEPEAKNIFL